MFVSQRAVALISSAACGADLLALEEAGRLGLQRKIILPWAPERFRAASVVDRPGEWGPLYDTVIRDADAKGDLLVLGSESGHSAYVAVNHRIVEEAIALGARRKCAVAAVLVWEGESRGADDLTEEFGSYAKSRGVPLLADVITL